MYKWIGAVNFPRRDGSGQCYVLHIAELQPDGQYRAYSTQSNGRSMTGCFVPVEVYNHAMALNLKCGDNIKVTWGPHNRIDEVAKA